MKLVEDIAPPPCPPPLPPPLLCYILASEGQWAMQSQCALGKQKEHSPFALFSVCSNLKRYKRLPPFHGKFLLLLLFRCLTLFTRCVPKKSRTTVTLCDSLQWTTLFCTRSPLTSSTTGTVSSNAHDCDKF